MAQIQQSQEWKTTKRFGSEQHIIEVFCNKGVKGKNETKAHIYVVQGPVYLDLSSMDSLEGPYIV